MKDLNKEILKYIHPEVEDFLNKYFEDKISKFTSHLVLSNDQSEIRLLQGKIRALRELKNIRSNAESVLKGK